MAGAACGRQGAGSVKHCLSLRAPAGGAAIRISVKAANCQRTDCHDQSADWSRNETVFGMYRRAAKPLAALWVH